MTWIQILFLLNGLWFFAAFVQFSVAQTNTAKILVPREARDNVLVPTLKASVAFLGGMNLALALLAFYLATAPAAFAAKEQQIVLFACFAAANFSQFWFNVPVALRGGQIGQAYWPVFSGPMLKIFVIDAALAVADAAAVFHFSTI